MPKVVFRNKTSPSLWEDHDGEFILKTVNRANLSYAVLLFSLAMPLLAQQTQSSDLAPVANQLDEFDQVDDERMPDPVQGLIRVDVAVTNKAGENVTGLSEKDFTLLDNDRQQEVVTFRGFDGAAGQPASSLEVVLVVDEMNMPRTPRNGSRELSEADREAETFLRADGGALQNSTTIYRLTPDALFTTIQASRDGNELATEIEQPSKQRKIWSASAIGKDIGRIASVESLDWRATHSLVALGSIAIEQRERPGRKLVFWIGNAWKIENHWTTGLSDFSIELLTRMREARMNLWSASEWPLYDASGYPAPVENYVYQQFLEGPKPDSTDLRYLSLPVIAARSGGGALYVKRNLAAEISKRVKNANRFYTLTFDPPRTDVMDEIHHLKVQIGEPDLGAHVFGDYYDQPVYYDQPPIKEAATVRHLEDVIANARVADEAELAARLDGMRLVERLSSANVTKLEKQVRGAKAREAFEVLADESAFLAPPEDEIPVLPLPGIALQREIVSRAISYIATTAPKLPDFFATRTTVQYQEIQPKPNQTWKTALPNEESLLQGETATDSIRFHDGRELLGQKSVKNLPHKSGNEQLKTIGAFGPILVAVMAAAKLPGSEIVWSRWERGETGDLAVFHYRVPEETRFFVAGFCCLTDNFGRTPFVKHSPFHGEIAVDPSTGAILRLSIQADLQRRLPLQRSDVVVEYRPVVEKGATFICPWRSISISRQRRTRVIDEWGESFKVYAPFETLLNEMRFEKYHIFGSTSRILPGFVEIPQ